jgi:hypothetical protein
MSKNWLLTIRTKLRDGTDKISSSPMIAETELIYQEALKIAVDMFGADRVISVTEK